MMNSGGIARAVLALVAAMAISGSAWAQYGGGGGGGMGSSGGGTYNPGSRSYGNGAKIGAAVAHECHESHTGPIRSVGRGSVAVPTGGRRRGTE